MPKIQRYRSGSVTFEAHVSRSGVLLTNVKPAGPIVGAQVKANGGMNLKLNGRISAGNGQIVLSPDKRMALIDFLLAAEQAATVASGTAIESVFEVAE